MRRMDVPIISSAVYPNMRSAAWFHDRTIPFKSLLTMASSDDSTMAARRRAIDVRTFRHCASDYHRRREAVQY